MRESKPITVMVPVDVHSQLPFETWRILILYLADGKCEFCPAIRNLHCHHIDQNRENNCLANGLCLCRSCHAEWHFAARTHTDMLIKVMQENRLIQLMRFMEDGRG